MFRCFLVPGSTVLTSCARAETMRKHGNQLTPFEQSEILEYQHIFFTGQPTAKKIKGIPHSPNNNGTAHCFFCCLPLPIKQTTDALRANLGLAACYSGVVYHCCLLVQLRRWSRVQHSVIVAD